MDSVALNPEGQGCRRLTRYRLEMLSPAQLLVRGQSFSQSLLPQVEIEPCVCRIVVGLYEEHSDSQSKDAEENLQKKVDASVQHAS